MGNSYEKWLEMWISPVASHPKWGSPEMAVHPDHMHFKQSAYDENYAGETTTPENLLLFSKKKDFFQDVFHSQISLPNPDTDT
jgi:hypothetical protein